MAQKVLKYLVDDLDGGDADETVTFALDGRFYEIDLSRGNAQKLRETLEPYRSKARRPGSSNIGAKGFSLRTDSIRTTFRADDSSAIRVWAKRYELPVNERGRVNSSYRDAYTAYRKDDREPLRRLLRENNLDPGLADTDGKTISAAPEAPKTISAEQRCDLAARKAGRLSSAQLTRLRKAHADPHGTYVSDGKSGDATSCEALTKRGLFKLLEDDVYEITPSGRAWFDVHDVSPNL